jgi:hypothetical protein
VKRAPRAEPSRTGIGSVARSRTCSVDMGCLERILSTMELATRVEFAPSVRALVLTCRIFIFFLTFGAFPPE